MQMNLLRKVSLLEFCAAGSSDAVKPTPRARIGLGRTGAAGLANGSNTPFTWNYLDGSDLKSSLAYPNGLTASWTYDANGQLLQVKNAFSTNVISQYDYTYDAAGRRVQIARSGTAMSETRTDVYGYNARSELISAAKSGGAQSSATEYAYSYDDIGNRMTSLDLGTNRTYTANSLNQYTAITDVATASSPSLDETFTPQFDDDGNQTLIKTSTGIWSVTYNGENRPTFWTCIQSNNSNNTNNQTISMSYDRMGRRLTKNGQRFVYDGYLQIANFEHQTSNIKLQTFIWDPTEPIATRPLVWLVLRSLGEGGYYTHDGNKNVSEVVASDGSLAAHYDYAPFGASSTSYLLPFPSYLTSSPWRFSCEYADDDLELVYYNHRHYNPLNGRWLSRDPIGGGGGIGLYLTCNNRLCAQYDRLGLIKYIMSEKNCTLTVKLRIKLAFEDGVLNSGKEMKWSKTEKKIFKDNALKLVNYYFNDNMTDKYDDNPFDKVGGWTVGYTGMNDEAHRRKYSSSANYAPKYSKRYVCGSDNACKCRGGINVKMNFSIGDSAYDYSLIVVKDAFVRSAVDPSLTGEKLRIQEALGVEMPKLSSVDDNAVETSERGCALKDFTWQYGLVHEIGHLLGLEHPGQYISPRAKAGSAKDYDTDRQSLMGRGMALRPADFTRAFCSHIPKDYLKNGKGKWVASYLP